ncbi:MAG: hypothetical protein CMG75_09460 [Candidatus Marinimicrobia bacterium]|nr:hypothetical protein [Candidatus Neomarinimicrobiota bacterium]
MNQKIKKYTAIAEHLDSLIENDDDKYSIDKIGKMAIISWVLKHHFPHFIFAGFYIVSRPKTLTLGPYQGDMVPCSVIPFGKGVCGISAEKRKSLIVDNVKGFPEYIACDENTASEIVVPVFEGEKVTAVLDIDSGIIADFNSIDENKLRRILLKHF